MGHVIENTTSLRSDFNDETLLYQIKLLLDTHPINGCNMSQIINLDALSSRRNMCLAITNKELNGPISISISSYGITVDAITFESQQQLSPLVDITKILQTSYDEMRKSMI